MKLTTALLLILAGCSSQTAGDSGSGGSGGQPDPSSGGTAGNSVSQRMGGNAGAERQTRLDAGTLQDSANTKADAAALDGAAAGTVPLFVAQAFGALMTVSCDDGVTWKKTNQFNTSNDDHSEFSSQGLAYGNGAFVGVFGWGAPNSAYRSEDGAVWTRVFHDNFIAMGDIAFGRGVFLGGATISSSDNGRTFAPLPMRLSARRTYFIEHGAGRFFHIDNSPLSYSDDAGRTWTQVKGDSNCQHGSHFGGNMALANGVTVLTNDEGYVCRSTDGGANLNQVTKLPSGVSGFVWGDGKFIAAVNQGDISGRIYTSIDGLAWTPTIARPAGTRVMWLRQNSVTGTWVGVDEGGQFFRSSDLVTWTPTTKFAGARFSEVVFGLGQRPAICN